MINKLGRDKFISCITKTSNSKQKLCKETNHITYRDVCNNLNVYECRNKRYTSRFIVFYCKMVLGTNQGYIESISNF